MYVVKEGTCMDVPYVPIFFSKKVMLGHLPIRTLCASYGITSGNVNYSLYKYKSVHECK